MKGARWKMLAVTASALVCLLLCTQLFPNGRLGRSVEIDTGFVHERQAPQALERQMLVNINTADAERLQDIAGVGPVLAQAILDYREQHGPFTELEQLKEVSGIGEAKLEQMRPYCCIE